MDLSTQPATTPAPDAETVQWESLQKEVGDAPQTPVEPAQPTTEAAPVEPEAPKAEPEADDDKPLPPEEIQKRYRQLQGALREERAARKAEADTRKNMEALFRQISEQRQAPEPAKPEATQPTAPAIPDINEDPIGHFQAKFAEQERIIAELRGQTTKTQEQVTAERQHQAFWSDVASQEEQFRAKTPDYNDATLHLETARMRELEIMFPDSAPGAQQMARENNLPDVAALRMALLNADRLSVAQQAKRMGINPGEVYYSLAKQRGYAPKSAQPAPTPAATQIATAQAGQQAVNAMRSGVTTNNEMTLEDIAELYITDPKRADQEFARIADRLR